MNTTEMQIEKTLKRAGNGARARRVTAADVAQKAGVQRACVSVVLNGAKSSATVSPAARERILAAAAQLDYHPSASARALATGRTMQIAFVAHDSVWWHLQDEHMTELHGLMRSVAQAGYRLLILPPIAAANPTRVAEIAQAGDALCVLAAGFGAEFFAALQESGTPFVVLGNPGVEGVPRVDQDNFWQIFASVEWLAARGHHRILLAHPIGLRGGQLPHRVVINRAYRDAMREFCSNFEVVIEPTIDLSPAQLAGLAGEHGADAIITRGVATTFDWRTALEAHGKRVPDDVTLLAHLATRELKYAERCGQATGLACLIHDRQTSGQRAGEALLAAIEGATLPDQPILLRGLGPCWHDELHQMRRESDLNAEKPSQFHRSQGI